MYYQYVNQYTGEIFIHASLSPIVDVIDRERKYAFVTGTSHPGAIIERVEEEHTSPIITHTIVVARWRAILGLPS